MKVFFEQYISITLRLTSQSKSQQRMGIRKVILSDVLRRVPVVATLLSCPSLGSPLTIAADGLRIWCDD